MAAGRRPKKAGTPKALDPRLGDVLARLRANLRRLRRLRGMTQQALADACEMEHANYQPIEAGKINVTALTLVRLAGALGVDVTELVRPVVVAPDRDPSVQ